MNIGPIESIASELARKAHAGQTRRDGLTPYITHPAAVAEIVRQAGGSDEQIAVAWLHDVTEDAGLRLTAMLEAGIPAYVASAVGLLTKGDQSYSEYLSYIVTYDLARKVKIADMLHNLSDAPSDAQKAKYIAGIMYLSK